MKAQGKELGKIIEQSLEIWRRKYVISKNNGEKYKNGKTAGRLGTALRYFGLEKINPNKKIVKGVEKPEVLGVNDLRHSRVTYSRLVAKDTEDKKYYLAKNMLHAEETADEVYMRELGDGVQGRLDKDFQNN